MNNERILQTLDRLYHLSFTLDRDLRIHNLSKRLVEHLPNLEEGDLLLERFEIRRPASINAFEDVKTEAQKKRA